MGTLAKLKILTVLAKNCKKDITVKEWVENSIEDSIDVLLDINREYLVKLIGIGVNRSKVRNYIVNSCNEWLLFTCLRDKYNFRNFKTFKRELQPNKLIGEL